MSNDQKAKLIDDLLNESMISAGGTGLSDTITITLDSSEYSNLTSYSPTYLSSGSTITLTNSTIGAAGSSYTIGSVNDFNTSSFNWGNPEEWVDSFPDWQRVQDMCSKYPSLEIALRNFRTIYTLVKDDYDNPKDKE